MLKTNKNTCKNSFEKGNEVIEITNEANFQAKPEAENVICKDVNNNLLELF